jgi:Protein of unknown function (DUF2798)
MPYDNKNLFSFYCLHKMLIPPRFTSLLFAFFMSMLMAFIMSGILTFVNLGPVGGFFFKWMHAFVIAWACAFPTVLVVAPIVRRIVAKLTVD